MKEMKHFDALDMKMVIDCKKNVISEAYIALDELGVIYP